MPLFDKNNIVSGLGVLMLSACVQAESTGISVGPGLKFYPSFDFNYVYLSNFFSTADDEESVTGALFNPEIRLEKSTRRLTASAGVQATRGDFDNGDQDDYTDSKADTNFRYRAGARHRFLGDAFFARGHDPFGQRRTEGLVIADRELDEYHHGEAVIAYRYGAPNSLLNAEYEISYYEREYDTNRGFTQFLDYNYLRHQGSLYWNYSPKTSAILRASSRDIEYPIFQSGFVDRSATEEIAAVGLEWLPSGKTSGKVLLGSLRRKAEDSRFDDFSGAYWAVKMDWTPRTPTSFSLVSGRSTNESYLTNSSVVDTQMVGVSWEQKWSPVATSTIGVNYSERDFEEITRSDEFLSAQASLLLRVAKELHINAKLVYNERDSTLPARAYDQSVFSVGFRYAR